MGLGGTYLVLPGIVVTKYSMYICRQYRMCLMVSKNQLPSIYFIWIQGFSPAVVLLHVLYILKKQMELVDKPGYKSAVWKYFGLRCDVVIDWHEFCRERKGKVAAHNGNTSNFIAHLRNNHPTIYANFWKGQTSSKEHKRLTTNIDNRGAC